MKATLFHTRIFIVALMLTLIGSISNAQTFNCYIANDALTSPNTLRFDVYMVKTSGADFSLRTVQYAVSFNPAFINGGNITPSFVSSDMVNYTPSTILWSAAGSSFQVAANTLVTIGTGTNIGTTPVKIGTWQIVSDGVYACAPHNVSLVDPADAVPAGLSLRMAVTAWHTPDPTGNNTSISGNGTYSKAPSTLYTNVNNLRPSIDVNPTAQTTSPCPTATASFSVTASSVNTGLGTITYQWLENGSPISNDASHAGVTTASLTITDPAGALNGKNYSVVVTQCGSRTSTTATLTSTACTVALNLKLFIQGYYIGGGQMTPVLANEGVGVNPNEVDTILVELRTALNPTTVVESATGVLMTDGTASLTFSGAVSGNQYYVAVKHRNAIQTWSATDIAFTPITSYDFSSDPNNSFGPNTVEIDPSIGANGLWAFYSGDIDQDENVTIFDYPLMESDILNFNGGYLATDLDGDGGVTIFDYPIMEPNILNFVGSIHP